MSVWEKSGNLSIHKNMQPLHTHKNHATSQQKHRQNHEKLPWELVGCQGVEVIKKNCDKTQKLKFKKKIKLWQNLKKKI